MSPVELSGRLVSANRQEAATVARHLPRHIELTRAEPGCPSCEVQLTDDPLVWSVAGAVFGRRPQVPVDVQRHRGRAVPEGALDGHDVGPLGDQPGGVEVSEVVEP